MVVGKFDLMLVSGKHGMCAFCYDRHIAVYAAMFFDVDVAECTVEGCFSLVWAYFLSVGMELE